MFILIDWCNCFFLPYFVVFCRSFKYGFMILIVWLKLSPFCTIQHLVHIFHFLINEDYAACFFKSVSSKRCSPFNSCTRIVGAYLNDVKLYCVVMIPG